MSINVGTKLYIKGGTEITNDIRKVYVTPTLVLNTVKLTQVQPVTGGQSVKIAGTLTYKPTSDLHLQCKIDGVLVKFKIPANNSTYITGGYYETDATYSTTAIVANTSHTINDLRFNSTFHPGISYNGSAWLWSDFSQKYSLQTLSYSYNGGLQTPTTTNPQYNINIHRFSGLNGFTITITSQGSVTPKINMSGEEGASTIYQATAPGGGIQSGEWVLKVKSEVNNKIYYIKPVVTSSIGVKDGQKIIIDITNPFNYTTLYPWSYSPIPDATETTGGYSEFASFNVMNMQFMDIVFSNSSANSNTKNFSVY